jgi:FAD/FMN-containing dehydrogenase
VALISNSPSFWREGSPRAAAAVADFPSAHPQVIPKLSTACARSRARSVFRALFVIVQPPHSHEDATDREGHAMRPLDERHLSQFRSLVGETYVLTGANDLEAYGRDWTRLNPPKPSAVVLPASTEEVSKVMRYCHQEKIAVVPSGGRTGLAGGAVAANGEIVLSLQRLNKIEAVDTVGLTLRCQAGVTTQAVQDAARAAGLFFPLDLAAKGSCHIGGNIATNAGGVKFIRFGGMREQVLGVEVVLPDGEVLDMNTSLRKNNTGYDLRQLFIGSEGTLGIVTRATLRLTPPPRGVQVGVMAVEKFSDVLGILGACARAGAQLTAFEFFTRAAHEIVLKHAVGARPPFTPLAPFYVLLEVETGPGGGSVLEPLLEKLFEAGLVTDAVVAGSAGEAKELWGLRENITESIAKHGHVRKNDISLGIDQLADYIAELETIVASAPGNMELVLFGHIGDGNIHINYVGTDKSEPFAAFQERARKIEIQVFELLGRYKGSVSAEHGIGLIKKKDLHFSRTDAEVALMRKLKHVLDPHGILNPGKIFD